MLQNKRVLAISHFTTLHVYGVCGPFCCTRESRLWADFECIPTWMSLIVMIKSKDVYETQLCTFRCMCS